MNISHNSMGGSYTTNSLLYIFGIIVLDILLSLIGIAAVIGNVFVVISVTKFPRLRSQLCFHFLASLAIADICVSVLVMPWSLVYMSLDYWPLGTVACLFWLSCDVMCCTASILHLCLVAIDRYLAIAHPLLYPRLVTSLRINISVVIVWITSITISFLPIYRGWNTNIQLSSEEVTRYDSLAHSPAVINGKCDLVVNPTYALVSSLTSFYLPFLALCCLYARIFQIARIQAVQLHKTRNLSQSSCQLSVSKDSNYHLSSENSETSTQKLNKNNKLSAKEKAPHEIKCENKVIEDLVSLTVNSDDAGVNNTELKVVSSFICTHLTMYLKNRSASRMHNNSMVWCCCCSHLPFPASLEIRQSNNTCGCRHTDKAQICRDKQKLANRLGDKEEVGHAKLVCKHSVTSQYLPSSVRPNVSARVKSIPTEAGESVKTCFMNTTQFAGSTPERSQRSRILSSVAAQPRSAATWKHQTKAIKTVGLLLGCFAACWLPFFVAYLIIPWCKLGCTWLENNMPKITWIGYLNSAINPLLYCFLQREFRYAFKRLLFRCLSRIPYLPDTALDKLSHVGNARGLVCGLNNGQYVTTISGGWNKAESNNRTDICDWGVRNEIPKCESIFDNEASNLNSISTVKKTRNAYNINLSFTRNYLAEPIEKTRRHKRSSEMVRKAAKKKHIGRSKLSVLGARNEQDFTAVAAFAFIEQPRQRRRQDRATMLLEQRGFVSTVETDFGHRCNQNYTYP